MRKFIKAIGVVSLAIVVFIPLSVSITNSRGYWAVGGEIFVPIILMVWGIDTVMGGKDEK